MMKITKSQLREIIKEELLKEAQWGGFTGGAAPLNPDPVDSGPIPLGQLKQLFDLFIDMGKPVEDILAMPEYVEAGITNPEQLGEATLKERAAIPMEEILRAEDIIKKHLEEMFDEIGRDNLPDRFSVDILLEPIINKYIRGRRAKKIPHFNKLTGKMSK